MTIHTPLNGEPSPRDLAATSFGTESAAYNRGRPGYPRESVAWLLDGSGRTVVDVGAGTGKLSAVIAATGRRVIAVDPDPAMLAALTERYPGIHTALGTGEHLPLPDGSADAITYGQAWHWVGPERASTEAARVLRPGGTLGLIWNIRDERVDWVRELTALMHSSNAEQMIAHGGPEIAAPFDPPELNTREWTRTMSPDDLLAMVRSRSYVITSDPEEQTRIFAAIRELLSSHPQTAGRSAIELPYVTHAYRTTVPS
ncbi:class I SAM-dependent methyltransferase [Klugiella xanthotipulae]|nr:class I SAM-dependent methyltransferase [Klugiella xanthotipulae]